jgi:hypothetical protein
MQDCRRGQASLHEPHLHAGALLEDSLLYTSRQHLQQHRGLECLSHRCLHSRLHRPTLVCGCVLQHCRQLLLVRGRLLPQLQLRSRQVCSGLQQLCSHTLKLLLVSCITRHASCLRLSLL